jgi:predicted PurR-regulated permease PerM
MERKVFFALVAYTFLLLFLYLLYIIVSPFLAALGWAAVIVIATYPVYKCLLKLFRTKPTVSAAIMTTLVFLIIVIPATILVGTLVKEATHAQQAISEWSNAQPAVTLDRVLNHPWVAPVVNRLQNLVKASHIDLKAAAIQGARRLTSFLLDTLRGAVMQAAFFLFQLILILISLFFLYRDGPRLTQAFLSTLPIPEDRKAHIHGTVEGLVSAVVIGVLVTATLQGLLSGLGYWFAGLPSPALLGTLSGVCALIPVVGSAVVWIPAVAYLLISGDNIYGLVLLGWCILVVGVVDNFLRPLLISGRSGLSFTLMALGGIGGLAAFGFFGLVAGPVIIALFMLVLEMYQSEFVLNSGAENKRRPSSGTTQPDT